MEDLRTVLSEQKLAALRAAYDRDVTSRATSSPFAVVYPPLDAWVTQTATTFFGPTSPLLPRDRERCVIALLAQSGAPMSLAIHIYWGLMEGLSVDEVCQTVALSGVYGGVQKVAQGFVVFQRVLGSLVASVEMGATSSEAILGAFVRDFR